VDEAGRLGRLIQQLEHTRATDHTVLRERHDLHVDRAAQRGHRRADRLDAAQADPEVDVDMGAGGGRRPGRRPTGVCSRRSRQDGIPNHRASLAIA
jgi:hypothetical protein